MWTYKLQWRWVTHPMEEPIYHKNVQILSNASMHKFNFPTEKRNDHQFQMNDPSPHHHHHIHSLFTHKMFLVTSLSSVIDRRVSEVLITHVSLSTIAMSSGWNKAYTPLMAISRRLSFMNDFRYAHLRGPLIKRSNLILLNSRGQDPQFATLI